LHPNAEDLQILLEIFPHCEVPHLLVTLCEQSEESKSLLGFTMPSKVLIGLALAINEYDLTALSEAVAITSVLFRMEWPEHDRFVVVAYPLIVEVVRWDAVELEVWHDCLDIVCYSLTTLDIDDPDTMQYVIGRQITLCHNDTYLCYEDRVRVIQFFVIILLTQEPLTDEQIADIENFMATFFRESL
jgi:hypothetical protein